MAKGLIVDVLITKTVSKNIVTINLPANAEVHYKLFNTEGKLAFSKSILMVNNSGKVDEDLNLSDLAEGEYVLKVLVGDTKQEIETIKITI